MKDRLTKCAATFLAACLVLAGWLGPLSHNLAWADDDQGTEESTTESASEPEQSTDEEAEADENGEHEVEQVNDIGPALGLTIVGVAALAGGIGYILSSSGTHEQADLALAAEDLVREESLRDRAERERTLGLVLTSLGFVAVGAATYMWLDHYIFNPPNLQSDQSSSENEISFYPAFGPNGATLLIIDGTF